MPDHYGDLTNPVVCDTYSGQATIAGATTSVNGTGVAVGAAALNFFANGSSTCDGSPSAGAVAFGQFTLRGSFWPGTGAVVSDGTIGALVSTGTGFVSPVDDCTLGAGASAGCSFTLIELGSGVGAGTASFTRSTSGEPQPASSKAATMTPESTHPLFVRSTFLIP